MKYIASHILYMYMTTVEVNMQLQKISEKHYKNAHPIPSRLDKCKHISTFLIRPIVIIYMQVGNKCKYHGVTVHLHATSNLNSPEINLAQIFLHKFKL